MMPPAEGCERRAALEAVLCRFVFDPVPRRQALQRHSISCELVKKIVAKELTSFRIRFIMS